MRKVITKISNGVKENRADIILIIGVILISLLSFAIGYIIGKTQEKEPIQIEYELHPKFVSQISGTPL